MKDLARTLKMNAKKPKKNWHGHDGYVLAKKTSPASGRGFQFHSIKA
jgi:hypothetical protein